MASEAKHKNIILVSTGAIEATYRKDIICYHSPARPVVPNRINSVTIVVTMKLRPIAQSPALLDYSVGRGFYGDP